MTLSLVSKALADLFTNSFLRKPVKVTPKVDKVTRITLSKKYAYQHVFFLPNTYGGF